MYVAIKPLTAAEMESGPADEGKTLVARSGHAAWESLTTSGITDITYADLVAAIDGSALTGGQFYRITDFATTHYIVDGEGLAYTTGDGVIVGATEALVVLATGPDTLASQAWSALHPEDIIYYDWNPANWMLDNAFAVDGTIITGWTGVITFRHDLINDNYAGYDFRGVRFRRWETAAAEWSVTAAYNQGDYVHYSAEGVDGVYWALAAIPENLDPGNDPPTVEGAPWAQVLDLLSNTCWNASPMAWNGIPSGEGYADFPTFGPDCQGNHIGANPRVTGMS